MTLAQKHLFFLKQKFSATIQNQPVCYVDEMRGYVVKLAGHYGFEGLHQ